MPQSANGAAAVRPIISMLVFDDLNENGQGVGYEYNIHNHDHDRVQNNQDKVNPFGSSDEQVTRAKVVEDAEHGPTEAPALSDHTKTRLTKVKHSLLQIVTCASSALMPTTQAAAHTKETITPEQTDLAAVVKAKLKPKRQPRMQEAKVATSNVENNAPAPASAVESQPTAAIMVAPAAKPRQSPGRKPETSLSEVSGQAAEEARNRKRTEAFLLEGTGSALVKRNRTNRATVAVKKGSAVPMCMGAINDVHGRTESEVLTWASSLGIIKAGQHVRLLIINGYPHAREYMYELATITALTKSLISAQESVASTKASKKRISACVVMLQRHVLGGFV
ncbi:hypothetical protein BDK51DRAFT_27532 [Blyttiomyces helicus]|uniref:Uncharacterized protein n=1 Tax=Blyttiomyces helicus TaxID=388810 RepID=A0A4P9WB06_9FUNG|nr:hypothetical protein BDK51DRAFT_27532 [Blyttiomyces helicus]|eukprot:RKO88765.1 hypothetical protein BDK51DRAFT_27532 [Blyttiomyces helicus]